MLVLSPTGPARVHRSGKAVGPLAEVASQSIVPYKTALSLCHRPLLCYFHALQCCQRYHFFHRGGWRWWRCRGRRRRGMHLRKPPHPAPSFGPMIRALFAYLFPTCLPPAPFQPHLQRHHTCVLVLIFKVICNQTVHPPFRFFTKLGYECLYLDHTCSVGFRLPSRTSVRPGIRGSETMGMACVRALPSVNLILKITGMTSGRDLQVIITESERDLVA